MPLFASNEAGRAVAIGVAVSALVHLTVAWTLAQYLTQGQSRNLELRAQVLAEQPREILGTFAQPKEGQVGGTIAETGGNGRRSGERASAAREETSDSTAGEAAETSDNPSEPVDASEVGARRNPDGSKPPEPAAADDQPADLPDREAPEATAASNGEGTDLVEPEREAPTAENTGLEPNENGSVTGPDSPDRSGEQRPTGADPSFPSIEGEGGEGSESEGDGEGRGTRGGVSVARIEQVIRDHRDEILECYASHHDYISDGTKVVVVEFWIGTDGRVERVRNVHRTTNPRVADCMGRRIAEWQFPELDRTVSFMKQFTIDARMEADWIKPRLPERQE